MYEYDEECLRTFLKRQSQLFDEPVAMITAGEIDQAMNLSLIHI